MLNKNRLMPMQMLLSFCYMVAKMFRVVVYWPNLK